MSDAIVEPSPRETASEPTAALVAALPVARAGLDPEGVHELRAQALRLSIALALRGLHALRSDLAWVRSELRRARDLDVALQRELADPLRAMLVAARRREQARILELVASPRFAGLVSGVSLALANIAVEPRRLRGWLRKAQGRMDRALRRPTDADRLHRLRKELRRVRLGLDELGLRRSGFGALTRELGAVCDAHSFRELLETLPQTPREHAAVAAWIGGVEREERLRRRHALRLVESHLDALLTRASRSLVRLERSNSAT